MKKTIQHFAGQIFSLKLFILYSLVLATCFADAYCQVAGYSGVVSCKQTGRLLKDVHIRILESGDITLTDLNGEFQIKHKVTKLVTILFDKPGFVVSEVEVSDTQQKINVELFPRKISSATHRWNKYIESKDAFHPLVYVENKHWQCDFKETKLGGNFAPDSTLIRRDPSAIIEVNGQYYVYYTRGHRFSKGPTKKMFPWDHCDLWYATSKDGWNWTEKGLAVKRGSAGSYDDCSVFTPEIFVHESKYYLVYQTVKAPYVDRVQNGIGMAVASSPEGPWRKLAEPILKPANNGIWLGDDDSRKAFKKGNFDSHKVHDPCLMFYKNKFYLYYKGQRVGEHRFYGEREIKWGVAISDHPEGPYKKSKYNPITTTGHEVCVWHYNGGIASIHTLDGPEAKTIQWARDGINFELMSTISNPPEALGLFRTDDYDKTPLEGIRWGLSHSYGDGHWRTSWNYIKRFDLIKEK